VQKKVDALPDQVHFISLAGNRRTHAN